MNSKGKPYIKPLRGRRNRAFTIVELMVVLAIVFVLMGLLVPIRAKSRNETRGVIDLSNLHQILSAVQVYAAQNTDFMPHPTWGSVPSGPTGWLYGSGMPSATVASPSQLDRAMSNQLVYFRKSQLAQYAGSDQKIFECPTDVDQRRSGTFKTLYLQRAVKLSAYTFTGAVSGFGAPKQAANADTGGTYKLSQFRPTSFLMWEADETVPFNFNDAAANQENASEGVSLRHSPRVGATTSTAKAIAIRGAFGGDAAYVAAKVFSKLRSAPAENDLRCGPGYR